MYHGKTLAEQNSVDQTWALLMSDQYKDLRACIYSTPEELVQFRQLVVNAVRSSMVVFVSLVCYLLIAPLVFITGHCY
jgi:hypothetical protein